MRVFVYEDAGHICVGTMSGELDMVESVNLSIPKGSDFLILNSEDLPEEPQESWYIEDGAIKIDQEKLATYNRSIMPVLTPIEFDLKLDKYGLYHSVQELIATDLSLKIAYTRATFFSRTDPFVNQARIALGLTNEQVDEMWVGG